MHVCTLAYEGKCHLNIIVNIHGTEKPFNVLIDTGFTSGTGFGLKLPAEDAKYAKFTGSGTVKVADGREVNAASIPDAKIVQIEQHRVTHARNTPTIFLGPSGVIGVLFLQSCHICFDGPNKNTIFRF